MTDTRGIWSHSTHVHAAIHRDSSPSDVGGAIRNQESHDLGDLFRLTKTTQRDLRQQRIALRIRQFTCHIGVDKTRRHRVHRDRPRTHFTRQRAAEALKTRLGCRVVDLASIAHGTDDRTNINDAAPARLGHAAQHSLGQAVEAVQVGVNNIEPLVVFHPQHQIIAGNTGVINQNQRLAEVLLNMFQSRGNRLAVTHIQDQASALNAIRLEGLGNALGTGRRSRRTYYHRALAPQLKRNGLTNTTACASNQRDLTLQAHIHFSLIQTSAARAEAKASGVSRLWVFTPLTQRLFKPDSTRPGPHSTRSVTPRSARQTIDSTQRTGLYSCANRSRLRLSRSCTTAALTFCTSGICGACQLMSATA